MLCNVMLCYCIVLYSVVFYCIVSYCIVLYRNVMYCNVCIQLYTHTVIYPNIILFNISNGAYNMYECADCENIVLSLGTHGSEVNLSGIKRSSCPFMPRQKALSFQHIFRPKIDVDEANIGGINRANPQIHWSILVFLLEISLQWNIRNNHRNYRQQIIRIISLYSYLLISFFLPPPIFRCPN